MVDGRFFAEIANLTRNVRIDGTAGGRSHVFIRSTLPSTVSHVSLTHMGPRKNGEKIVGRWPLHYHHVNDSHRGVVVDGVVVQKAGSHAFVTHVSHGMTLRNCVAYDVTEHAFWWDDPLTDDEITRDALWEDCLALLVHPPANGDVSGFYLGKGVAVISEPTTNTIRRCVTAASKEAGITVPGASAGSAWFVEDVRTHNNRKDGWKTYTNQGDIRPIGKITAYHNGRAGIAHGAYLNAFRFSDADLFANVMAGADLQALSTEAGLRYDRFTIDQGGYDYCVVEGNHSRQTTTPTVFEDCTFRGAAIAAIGVPMFHEKYNTIRVVNCTFVGNEAWLSDVMNQLTVVVIQDATRHLELRRKDQPGDYFEPRWNASVKAL